MQKFKIIVETPLFVASALLENDLIAQDARILQIQKRQYGLTRTFAATQISLKKCL